MKQRRLYTLAGVLLLAAFIYITFSPSTTTTGFQIVIPLPWLQPKMPFIGVNGVHFVELNNSTIKSPPVYINGWNSYWFLSSGSPSRVADMLRRGREMGLGVCRTWAFADGGPGALQISPGRYDERVFQALDFVIYEARRNKIRLILCLVNNLNQFGGKDQYVRWAQTAGENVSSLTDPFFSHPTIKGYYKEYVKTILARRNSYSGVKYSDEPAIFAWELINEPRCKSNSSAPSVQVWTAEMASYIKSLDNKHLVTVGLEGFYGHKTTQRLTNNPGKWAASLCSDFVQNSKDEHVDFASVHTYPDTWLPEATLEEKVKYVSEWVESHVNDSQYVLKKPVLFTEVGFNLREKKNGSYDRDILLKTVYDRIYESAMKGRAGAGALIWQLVVDRMQGEDEFSLAAHEHPSTRKLIIQQSCRLRNVYGKLNPNSTADPPCTEDVP